MSESFKRPMDLPFSAISPDRIFVELGWKTDYTIKDIAKKMYNDELF